MSLASSPSAQQSRAEDVAALVASEGSPEAISEILSSQELEVAAFHCVDALLEQVGSRSVALIVVAVDDTAASLLVLLGPLVRRFDGVPVVLVCPSIQPGAVRTALAAGVAGVVLHGDLERALGPCMQAVRAGQLCIPRWNAQQVEPPVLSSREKQVLGLLVMGYMNSEIAGQLFLAESTVKSHLSSIFHKLGVRSRNEAVARILDPHGGLGVGILALGGESLHAVASHAQ